MAAVPRGDGRRHVVSSAGVYLVGGPGPEAGIPTLGVELSAAFWELYSDAEIPGI